VRDKTRIDAIDFIVIIIFELYYIMPSVSAEYNFVLPIILGISYIVFQVIKNDMKISTEIVKYLSLITFIAILYTLLIKTITISAEASNGTLKMFLSKFYQLFMMFIPVLFLKKMMNYASLRQKKYILASSYALFGYVIVLTMRELIINPNITRSWGEAAGASGNNIANYYFVYAIPVLVVLCTMFATRTRSIFVRGLIIAIIVYQMNFLLRAQYTISVLITILGIIYVIYISTERSRYRTIFILLFVCMIIASPWILRFAASHVPSEQMSIRLYEVYNFLVARDATGYNMNGRVTLYFDSIKAFLFSPIWGNRSLDFDGHATFLTVLSDVGLLGGVPFYYLYFSTNKKVRYLIEDDECRFKPVFFMLVLMGFTNPIHTALPLMYATWFVAPLTISVFKEYER